MKRRRPLPEFLSSKYSTVRAVVPVSVMSNWITVYQFIKKFGANEKDISMLRAMMFSEYCRAAGARMDIIVRLHGRFNSLRCQLERTQL